MVEARLKGLTDGHRGESPAVGLLPLREAAAQDIHHRHGVEVSPGSVMSVPSRKVSPT